MDPPDGSESRLAETPQAVDLETTAESVSASSGLLQSDALSATQATNPESAGDTTPQPPKSGKICGVCEKEPGKYKCPRCGISYCSVPCSKLHKANHPPDAPPPAAQPSSAPTTGSNKRPHEPAEDPYSILLDHRSDLERLFAKYPNLESDLVQIERATLPPPDAFLSSAPLSGGLPTKYVPPQQQRQQQEPWTRQVGLRKGAAALKRARTDPGEDGDAVREYCELVLHLLSLSRARREEEALDVVRRETADEERGVIKRLIKMEEEDH